jgi:hypothetical protein
MYTVDYFISKFEAIDEARFMTGAYEDNMRNTKCSLGHCMGNYSPESKKRFGAYYGEEFACLMKLFGDAPDTPGDKSIVAAINDGQDSRYQQSTPKQRILAALYDIKAMEQKKDIDTGGKEQPKTKTVYVTVPVSITEQSRELITN